MNAEIDPLSEFLSTVIVASDNAYKFSPYQLLQRLDLLGQLSQRLAELVRPDSEYLCAIATTGIPIAVGIARQLREPLIFFSSDGWNDSPQISNQKVLGTIPKHTKITIIDTSLRPGTPSSECYYYLVEQLDAEVLQIVSIFDFAIDGESINRIEGVEYTSLGSATDYARLLCGLLNVSSLEAANERYFTSSSPFWIPNDTRRLGTNNLFSKFKTLLAWPGRTHTQTIGSIDIQKRLRQIPTDDIGIWGYFKKPQLVAESITECIAQVNLNKYAGIIGLDVLGGALAIYAALEANYQGIVFIFDARNGLLPAPTASREFMDKKFLAFQLRLGTGRYAAEALHVIEQLGGTIGTLIAMKRVFGIINPRALPLRKLIRSGVQIFTME
jgi:orotate phosphoribosyltransferase